MRTRKYVALAGSLFITLGTGGLLAAMDTLDKEVTAEEVQQAVGVITAAEPTNDSNVTTAAVASPQIPDVPVNGIGAAGPVAAAAPRNIWTFLGVPTCAQMEAKFAKMRNMLGLPPAVKPIVSPDTLKSKNPAIKAAAEAKKEKDQTKQKVKAIKYLADLDNACCYPGVRDALLAALDDCDEKVRYEAAKAFGEACCCHPDVMKRLDEVVNKVDALGYHVEPSCRVREAAQKSMEACACRVVPPELEPEKRPIVPEAPKTTPEPAPTPKAAASVITDEVEATLIVPVEPATEASSVSPATSDRGSQDSSLINADSTTEAVVPIPVETYSVESAVEEIRGTVMVVDAKAGVAVLNLPEGAVPAVGSRVEVYHKYPLKLSYRGDMQVVRVKDGTIMAQPMGDLTVRDVKKGDRVVVIGK